jgi:hypothetical protein
VRVGHADSVTCATQRAVWTDAVAGVRSAGEVWGPEGEVWVGDLTRTGGWAPPAVPLLCRLLDGLRRLPCE